MRLIRLSRRSCYDFNFIGLSSLVKTMYFQCKALALSFYNSRIVTHLSLTGTTFSRS